MTNDKPREGWVNYMALYNDLEDAKANTPKAERDDLIFVREVIEGPAAVDRESLEEILGQFAGTASMCWEPQPEGVFQSQMAIAAKDEALKKIFALFGANPAPRAEEKK